MATPLLLLQDIQLTYGSTRLLDGAELSVAAGERVCLVGRNGSGKSSLLKVAAGLLESDRGTRFAQPGATIRYLPQEPDLSGFSSIGDYVEAGLEPGDDGKRAFAFLGKLGLSGAESTAHLSGGEARRAALARTLAAMPDILLLDEPTNHLDLPAIEWLEGELASQRAALVLISHDRRFLETLSRATIWLDRGQTRRLEKGFAAFESWRDEVLAQEEQARHKLDRRIAMEEDWVRYGVSGRRKRNQGRLARLGQMRQGRRDQLKVQGGVKFTLSEKEDGGTRVIDAKKISKSFGGRAVVDDLSVRILRGDRLALVGPNGAGKTTLLKMLTGELAPDTGNVKLGVELAMAKLEQNRDSLHPEDTVAAVLTGGVGDQVVVNGKPRHVVSYMRDFLFQPEQARTPARVLSGGERARLLLAQALAAPSNLLVLDEPTNDLDLETLDLLEEVLADYAGTVLLVSHDRDFLDRVASSILMAEGDGAFIEYAGGYGDMLAQRGSGVSARQAAIADSAEAQDESRGPAKPKAARESIRKRKLSFADQHVLKTLPGEIAELEKNITALQAKLADAKFYARDPDGFSQTSMALAKAEADLAEKETRWLEVEMLREEIEGGA